MRFLFLVLSCFVSCTLDAKAWESKLELQENADRKGADICGKAYALDLAMLESITNSSRAGGMATRGEKSDPHLMCITGDGAGVS